MGWRGRARDQELRGSKTSFNRKVNLDSQTPGLSLEGEVGLSQ